MLLLPILSLLFHEMATLPTLYQYYAGPPITQGLSANESYFTLNNKNFTLYGGSMHYFRVPQEYWRDRLRKMRAAGLNTVTTYVPWNLHEPQPGLFEFGHSGTDMEQFTDLEKFLRTVQEEDLLTIVRPGPFICAEWEFGGLPSWLLREKDIRVRTSQPKFMERVKNYFDVLLPILAAFQFTKGGSIIALQVENEYGSTGNVDKDYLRQLVKLHRDNGIVELLFSSDSPTLSGTRGTLPGILLQTANFGGSPIPDFKKLQKLQPGKPTMATEYWSGWFDHWAEKHNTKDTLIFKNYLTAILEYPASVNMYMFHGGTSWGFLNGANIDREGNLQPDTTSYDYDAAISENGDYGPKYEVVVNLLKEYSKLPLRTPERPDLTPRVAYPAINVTQQLKFNEMINQVPGNLTAVYHTPIAMELLNINNQTGQSYGYVLYRKTNLDLPPNSTLMISGRVSDTVVVLLNGVLISKPLKDQTDLTKFGFWKIKNGTLTLGDRGFNNATLDLLVENWGRNNFGALSCFKQYKGIWQGGIFLNNEEVFNWQIVPIEFKKKWTNGLEGWNGLNRRFAGPSLYKASFDVSDPRDTYVDMREWNKGIVIVNGFVLGKYAAKLGPQHALYLPAPFLKCGTNDIVVFEHYEADETVKFSKHPIYQCTQKVGTKAGQSCLIDQEICTHRGLNEHFCNL